MTRTSLALGALAGAFSFCMLVAAFDCSTAMRQRMKDPARAAVECRMACEAAGLRVGSFSLESRRCQCTTNYKRNVIEVRR